MKRCAWWFTLLPLPVWADSAVPAGPSTLMSMVQVVLGLGVVLAAIVGCAWLFKRMSHGMIGIPRHLRVVSAVMVGQRERVVIVEMGEEWLVLGVTAQSITLLSTRPRPADADMPSSPSLPSQVEPFSRWLKAALDKRRGSSSDDLKR
jgi:flagellar protein FliO/FliZ